jgi:hypothetical protein
MDESDALDIGSVASAYEIDLEKEVEKAEEFKNQFYDGLEAQPELFKTEPMEDKPNPDEDDEDIDKFINEIDGTEFASLPTEEEPDLSGKEPTPSKIRQTLQPLAPVRINQIKEIELELSIPSIESRKDYRDLLHQEIGESKEMYKMREKISNLIAAVEVPRGKSTVGLDAPTIILMARMITNKLWFGMKYNKEQEELIKELVKYTPEIHL